MIASPRGRPRGALEAAYATAVHNLLKVVESDAAIVFAAVRSPKVRITVRLCAALCERLRRALARLNLKLTDFACSALDRYLSPLEGA